MAGGSAGEALNRFLAFGSPSRDLEISSTRDLYGRRPMEAEESDTLSSGDFVSLEHGTPASDFFHERTGVWADADGEAALPRLP